ncbi:hypothetical protein TNCV_3799651 [Trichonephila clavipes]|nr:hypothetical protein TNCV_3799651 [Trichonephila clavipes]
MLAEAVDGRGFRNPILKCDVSSRRHSAQSRQLGAAHQQLHVFHCVLHHRRRLLQRGLRAKIPLYRIPLTQNHRHLRHTLGQCA